MRHILSYTYLRFAYTQKKERKKQQQRTCVLYGKRGGETGERILFSLESRFLLRVHIRRRRKEEENAPIRNERRMFLSFLVSHFRVLTRRAHTIDDPKKDGTKCDDTSSPSFPGKEDVAK